jgi:hypothetical protein
VSCEKDVYPPLFFGPAGGVLAVVLWRDAIGPVLHCSCIIVGMSGDDLDQFIDHWVYEIDGVLRRQLDNLKDDLRSDDEGVRKQAESEADEILDWLLPAPAPLTDAEKLQRVKQVIANERLSTSERRTAATRALRSTGRRKGRPRDSTSQQAIRALTLHLATPKSWREIALEIRGCNHKRPHPTERSCAHCGDAAGRLDSFLKSKGYHPNVPRRIEILSLNDPN